MSANYKQLYNPEETPKGEVGGLSASEALQEPIEIADEIGDVPNLADTSKKRRVFRPKETLKMCETVDDAKWLGSWKEEAQVLDLAWSNETCLIAVASGKQVMRIQISRVYL